MLHLLSHLHSPILVIINSLLYRELSRDRGRALGRDDLVNESGVYMKDPGMFPSTVQAGCRDRVKPPLSQAP